jgi:RNA polymerase sigma factor (sigma-70 family)
MKKEWSLTAEAFDKFLSWLDPDREQAGLKYENIRHNLVVIFRGRGCTLAEDMADEAINRVIRRAQEMAEFYVGDPAHYFYTVAHNLHLEYLRTAPVSAPLPEEELASEPNSTPEKEEIYDCLERCMQRLPDATRVLVLDYYCAEGQAKINHHRELAEQLGIAVNALRIRVYRLRVSLEKCIDRCQRQEPLPEMN